MTDIFTNILLGSLILLFLILLFILLYGLFSGFGYKSEHDMKSTDPVMESIKTKLKVRLIELKEYKKLSPEDKREKENIEYILKRFYDRRK